MTKGYRWLRTTTTKPSADEMMLLVPFTDLPELPKGHIVALVYVHEHVNIADIPDSQHHWIIEGFYHPITLVHLLNPTIPLAISHGSVNDSKTDAAVMVELRNQLAA